MESDEEGFISFGFRQGGTKKSEQLIGRDRRYVKLVYDWRVRPATLWMRWFLWLLRPEFAANHRWAMARGKEGLRREMARHG